MKRLLPLTAALEGITGLALIIAPAVVARLLLGAVVSGAGIAVAREALSQSLLPFHFSTLGHANL